MYPTTRIIEVPSYPAFPTLKERGKCGLTVKD